MVTVLAPPQTWTNLANKPAIFSDDQIDHTEVQNKPATYPPSSHVHSPSLAGAQPVETYDSSTAIGQAIINLIGGTTSGRLERGVLNAHYVVFIDGNHTSDSFAVVSRTTPSAEPDQLPDFVPMRVYSSGLLELKGRIIAPLPTIVAGLSPNSFWRDSNGFVRIV